MTRQPKHVARATREPVTITAYDPTWPSRFELEAQHLRACLPPGSVGRIAHFGSTAVPGLAAKPIIDMLVEVPSLQHVHDTIAPMLKHQGYEYFWRPSWRDGVTPEYTWFIKRNAAGERTHHLHMLEKGSALWDRLLFRDYLIAHPQVAQAYGTLKRRIAADTGGDRLAYARAKTRFIDDVMRLAHASGSTGAAGPTPGP